MAQTQYTGGSDELAHTHSGNEPELDTTIGESTPQISYSLTRVYEPCQRNPFVVEPSVLQSAEIITATLREQELLYTPRPEQARYHFAPHILQNEEAIFSLINHLKKQGIEVNERVVIDANLMHDDLFHLNPHVLGFETREDLAASVAYHRLIALGSGEEHARAVERTIFTTLALSKPESVEEVVMRAADLAGLTLPYDQFRVNTGKLHEEFMLVNGKSLTFEQFAEGTLNYLALYLWQDLTLSAPGQSPWIEDWHSKALHNCIALFQEISVDPVRVHLFDLDATPDGMLKIMTTEWRAGDMILVSVADDSAREQHLAALRAAKLPGPVFALPAGKFGSVDTERIH